MGLFKRMLDVIGQRNGEDDADALEAEIARLTNEASEAEKELPKLGDARVELLLAGDDDALDELDRKAERLHRIMERNELVVPRLQARLKDAREKAKYQHEKKLQAERVALLEEYLPLARKTFEKGRTVLFHQARTEN